MEKLENLLKLNQNYHIKKIPIMSYVKTVIIVMKKIL